MFSALGQLYKVLFQNRPHQERQFQEELHRINMEIWEAFGRLIKSIVDSGKGIRTSWTGWTRVHEKVKNETLSHYLDFKAYIFPRYLNRLIRWW